MDNIYKKNLNITNSKTRSLKNKNTTCSREYLFALLASGLQQQLPTAGHLCDCCDTRRVLPRRMPSNTCFSTYFSVKINHFICQAVSAVYKPTVAVLL
jgi:hypothetical protein